MRPWHIPTGLALGNFALINFFLPPCLTRAKTADGDNLRWHAACSSTSTFLDYGVSVRGSFVLRTDVVVEV
jgi:hypothetical protein